LTATTDAPDAALAVAGAVAVLDSTITSKQGKPSPQAFTRLAHLQGGLPLS
jgi:hypothetical protein